MPPKGKRRVYLSLEKRLSLLQDLNTLTAKAVAKKYKVSLSTVYIVRRRAKLLDKMLENGEKEKSDYWKERMRNKKLQSYLSRWFLEKRNRTFLVSDRSSHKMTRKLKVASGTQWKKNTWLKKYRQRLNMRLRDTNNGEVRVNRDKNVAKGVSLGLKETGEEVMMKEEKVNLDNMYNIDETVLLWKTLPPGTLEDENEDNMNREKIKLGLCANASGTHKMKPLVLYDYKNPTSVQQKKYWMDTDSFTQWYENDFKFNTRSYQLQKGISGKIYLLLKNCGHKRIMDKEDEEFQIIYLPADSSIIQPMDQGVIKKVKRFYRYKLTKRFIQCYDTDEEFMHNYSIEDCLNIFAESWEHVEDIRRNIKTAWSKLTNLTEEIQEKKIVKKKETDEEEILIEFQQMMGIILGQDTKMNAVIVFLTKCRTEEESLDDENQKESIEKLIKCSKCTNENVEENGDEGDEEQVLVIDESDNENKDEINEKGNEESSAEENDEQSIAAGIELNPDDENEDEINENENEESSAEEDDEQSIAAGIELNPDDENEDEINEKGNEESSTEENDEQSIAAGIELNPDDENEDEINKNENDESSAEEDDEQSIAAGIELNPDDENEDEINENGNEESSAEEDDEQLIAAGIELNSDDENEDEINENRNEELSTEENDEQSIAAGIELSPAEREEMEYIFERLECYYSRLPRAIESRLQACKLTCLGQPKQQSEDFPRA